MNSPAMRAGASVACAAVIAALAAANSALAVPFTTSYTDGSSWNTLYGQGFSPSEMPNPDPGLASDAIVPLDRFEFFKSGSVDTAANFRLAILSNFFMNLDTLTTMSPELAGLSTNTIASTAGIATGEPITFNFDSAPLTYGNDYAAIFVTEGPGGVLNPVLVATMLADYIETSPGSGMYVPESDYGDPEIDYFKSATSFINENEFGRFLASFNAPYGDASFVAYFDQPAEAIPGDYDNSGAVDGADLDVWEGQFGQTGTLAADGDGDSDVDGTDLLIWQRHVGEAAAAPAISAVPEPSLLALAVSAVGAALAFARRLPTG